MFCICRFGTRGWRQAGKRCFRFLSFVATQHDPVWVTVYFVMLSLHVLCHSVCCTKTNSNALWWEKKQQRVCFFFYPFPSHRLSEVHSSNCRASAKCRVTETMTAGGVTVMGTGTLPCSVLVHYSIISQWSPHKSELCATRGEVPYGTSDPERQRVAKDP